MLIVEWKPITETEEIPPFGVELERHIESRKGAVKHATCSAWNLLHQILLANGLPIGDVAFTVTGKPFIPDSDFHFSLSHSHGICAVAISDHPVGVDVEQIGTIYPPNMIKRSLTDAEKAVFNGDFTRLWCRKEAVAKMTGDGITGYPQNIDTTTFTFHEQQVEWNEQKYWLVAIEQEHHK